MSAQSHECPTELGVQLCNNSKYMYTRIVHVPMFGQSSDLEIVKRVTADLAHLHPLEKMLMIGWIKIHIIVWAIFVVEAFYYIVHYNAFHSVVLMDTLKAVTFPNWESASYFSSVRVMSCLYHAYEDWWWSRRSKMVVAIVYFVYNLNFWSKWSNICWLPD